MSNLDERTEVVVQQKRDVFSRFDAINYGRAGFKMKHFVVGKHDMPWAQWQQALIEFKGQAIQVEEFAIDQEILALEIERLEIAVREHEGDWEMASFDLRKKRLRYAELELDRTFKIRECESLWAIIQQIEETNGGPFTREQIEAQEPEYWMRRLTRQWREEQLPGIGHIRALLQMYTEPGELKPLMPGQSVATLLAVMGYPDDKIAQLTSTIDHALIGSSDA